MPILLRGLLPSLLLARGAAALIAGCGDRGEKPDTAGLIGSSLRAAAGQDDPSVHYDVNAMLDVTRRRTRPRRPARSCPSRSSCRSRAARPKRR